MALNRMSIIGESMKELVLPPGKELDKLVSAAMEKEGLSALDTDTWSSDADLVLYVCDMLTSKIWAWEISFTCHLANHPTKWNCVIHGKEENGMAWECDALGESLPHAFCLAFLQELDE